MRPGELAEQTIRKHGHGRTLEMGIDIEAARATLTVRARVPSTEEAVTCADAVAVALCEALELEASWQDGPEENPAELETREEGNRLIINRNIYQFLQNLSRDASARARELETAVDNLDGGQHADLVGAWAAEADRYLWLVRLIRASPIMEKPAHLGWGFALDLENGRARKTESCGAEPETAPTDSDTGPATDPMEEG